MPNNNNYNTGENNNYDVKGTGSEFIPSENTSVCITSNIAPKHRLVLFGAAFALVVGIAYGIIRHNTNSTATRPAVMPMSTSDAMPIANDSLNGYVYNENSNRYEKAIITSVKPSYVAPAGYVLVGDKCYKTIVDENGKITTNTIPATPVGPEGYVYNATTKLFEKYMVDCRTLAPGETPRVYQKGAK